MSRCSRRLNENSDEREPVPQWFFSAFTGDRSGSMKALNGASQKGLYDWIKTMIDSAKTNNQNGFISVTTFDDYPDQVLNNINVKNIEFTEEDVYDAMEPRGRTRLYDTAIEDIQQLLKNVDEFRKSLHPMVRKLNPKIAVSWVCCTDGEDNCSLQCTSDLRCNVMLARKKGVKCFFIAANQDAVIMGNKYGFNGDESMTFSSNRETAEYAFRAVSTNMRQASTGSSNTQFTNSMRHSSITPAPSGETYDSQLFNDILSVVANNVHSPLAVPLNQTHNQPISQTKYTMLMWQKNH